MLEVSFLEALMIQNDKNSVTYPFLLDTITNLSKNCTALNEMINDVSFAKVSLLSNANEKLIFDKLIINLLRR